MLITWTRMACISGVVFIVESQPTTKNVVLLYYGFAILLHLMRGVWSRMKQASNKYYTASHAAMVMQD